SRHRMTAALRTGPVKLTGGGWPGMARVSHWGREFQPDANPICPNGNVASVAVPSVPPSSRAVIVLPLNAKEIVCQVLVPSAAAVPLASVVTWFPAVVRRIDHAPVLLIRSR